MKKIITGVIAALVVIGAGVALWLVLDSSAAAATVGKTKITESQIKKSVDQILAERKTVSTTGMQLAFGSALNAEEVNYYVILALLTDAAKANNITLSEADVTAREASILKQEGSEAKLKSGMVSASIASGDFPGYVREILYVDALTKFVVKKGSSVADSGTAVQTLVRQQALKEGVKVAAKYGTWDPTQVTVNPPTTAN